MSLVKTKLAILTTDAKVVNQFATFEPLVLDAATEDFINLGIEILILDLQVLPQLTFLKNLIASRSLGNIQKIILIAAATSERINAEVYNSLNPNLISVTGQFQPEDLFKLSSEIQQSAQNNVYLALSSELNQEYEKIKLELETKLNDKAKNLIESRRKVFEVNSRIEFFRKILYTISEIKSLDTAEDKLNSLLTSYNKVTWFKIIASKDSKNFEDDIHRQLESTLFKLVLHTHTQEWHLFFFKGDKKPFKKNDLILFKKLNETLQINLSRLDKLSTLKKSENFFNLAFHSSKNPILVIDQNYVIHQANSAALAGKTLPEQKYCHQLLFDRNSPCVGCTLGKNFQIQEKNSFFNVHSQPLSLMEDENEHFWVHVYEDSTEQNLYEKKITQFARLEELGLISSSIAHELNNPLGGILSFIQIMKLELSQQNPLMNDLNLMHVTALRMKKIIEDLLIFSRSNHDLILEDVDLVQITHKVLAQFDLQFKMEKIKVSFLPPANPLIIKLSETLLQNTINLIFHFFLHQANLKKSNKQNFISLVEVKITQDQINYYLTFSANLGPFENEFKTKNLNLLAIEKALTDQGFQLFISEPAVNWIQLSILFSKV